jgi:hypothetical protein
MQIFFDGIVKHIGDAHDGQCRGTFDAQQGHPFAQIELVDVGGRMYIFEAPSVGGRGSGVFTAHLASIALVATVQAGIHRSRCNGRDLLRLEQRHAASPEIVA